MKGHRSYVSVIAAGMGFTMSTHRELFERLRDHWVSEGIQILPGATEGEIAAWEALTGVALTPEFREYLTVVNGMGDWEYDHDWISFHSLNRMKEVYEGYGTFDGLERGFGFADYSLHGWDYGVQVSPDSEASPVLCLYGEGRNPVVAPSFPEFIRHYLEDPDPVLFQKPA